MIAAKVSDGPPIEGETLLPAEILDFIANLIKQTLDPKRLLVTIRVCERKLRLGKFPGSLHLLLGF
jgi:hypothetical protein